MKEPKMERRLLANGETFSPEAYEALKRGHKDRKYECEYVEGGWLRVYEIVKRR